MSDKKTVQVFECEVRHGGDLLHSLAKRGVTDREIRVLRAIHGDDAVVNVKEMGKQEIDQQEELYELAVRYSKSFNHRHGRALVERTLNVSLTGLDKWLQEREQMAQMERQEKREKSQKEAAMYARAREAAEARVRADIAIAVEKQGQPA